MDLGGVPLSALGYLCEQLDLDRESLVSYPRKKLTRWEHFDLVRNHLGISNSTADDLVAVESWLSERALEHNSPKVLFRLSQELLRSSSFVLPSADRLVRMVGSARTRAAERTHSLLQHVLTSEMREKLDQVLEASDSPRWSTLEWLCCGASGDGAKAIKTEVKKLEYVRGLGAHEWALAALNPNRRCSVGTRHIVAGV